MIRRLTWPAAYCFRQVKASGRARAKRPISGRHKIYGFAGRRWKRGAPLCACSLSTASSVTHRSHLMFVAAHQVVSLAATSLCLTLRPNKRATWPQAGQVSRLVSVRGCQSLVQICHLLPVGVTIKKPLVVVVVADADGDRQ